MSVPPSPTLVSLPVSPTPPPQVLSSGAPRGQHCPCAAPGPPSPQSPGRAHHHLLLPNAPCPLHSWAPSSGAGVQPHPCPSHDTKPSLVAASAVVYWVGARSPQQCGKHRGGAMERAQEPEPRLLRQGPISSLTKAAMQYWRATGNPKLQYLRAARALLTALHGLQTPPPCPKHREGSLGPSFARERPEEQ